MSNRSWHGGKGSAPRPISDKDAFNRNWDKIFGNQTQAFWEHRCKHNGLLMIGKSQECSWCGETEEGN